jgi:phosphate transport system substrate-binding protein
MRINYAPTGSSDGRQEFINGTVDFADSDIPFQTNPTDGSAPERAPVGEYAYIPITAGGTTFMYNLIINGRRVTNLRLSGLNIAKIYAGQITNWADPAIAADNPGLHMPNRQIIPVVRSDGSGSTAQLTLWMISRYSGVWQSLCSRSGRAPACGETSYFPTLPGMIAQAGDLGVAGYVSQGFADGAIGYVEYSYALNAGFPVAKMLNVDGYYTLPTPYNVAVSLLKAQVDTRDVNNPAVYLTQQLGDVYTDRDPRTYPLSSYSYMIIPTQVLSKSSFTQQKGVTLSAFLYFAMCQGQQSSATLGYSPMPIDLVEDSFAQIVKIPGAVRENINIRGCNNPTFTPSGANLLAQEAPLPPACDHQGPTQCSGSGTQSGGSGSGGSGSAQANGGSSSNSGAATGGASGTGAAATTARGGSLATRSASGRGSTQATAGAATQGAAQHCDAATGVCGTSASSGSGGAQEAAANPFVINASQGWGSTQTLMVLAGVLLLALILGPALISWHYRRRVP